MSKLSVSIAMGIVIVCAALGCESDPKASAISAKPASDAGATRLAADTGATSRDATSQKGPPAEEEKKPPRGAEVAAELNKAGLALRKAGDNAGAMDQYKNALLADPRFEPARYNHACELALASRDREALDELSALLEQGTYRARTFVAHAANDSDFDSLRDDPRLLKLLSAVTLDPDKPAIAQTCADTSLVSSLVDHELGLVHHLETEQSADEEGPEPILKTAVVKKAVAAKVVGEILDPKGAWCNVCLEEGNIDFIPAKSGAATRCLVCDMDVEWGSSFELCFVKRPRGWKIALASQVPTGPLSEEFSASIKSHARKARQLGLKRFEK